MSIGQQFKGKVIWGTSVWRILLETDDRKLHNEFQGSLTLYERRHEKSTTEFKNLDEFVNILRDMWKDSLRSDIVQDTRLARWIEEYFNEENIVANYNEILDATRGEFEEVPPIQLSQKTKLEKEELEELIQETEEFLASGTKYKIQGELGDADEVNRSLENFMISNKPKRGTLAQSRVIYTLPDRTERTMELEKQVKDHALRDVVTLSSGLKNDFGVPIRDVKITDVIPFDYQVTDIKISGMELSEPDKNRIEHGLGISWNIEHMQPREQVEIEYQLQKRMLRTILIRDDFDLIVLQTFGDIEHDDQGEWIESSYLFKQNTPVVENVKILDLIPGEYRLVESKPEAIPPLAQIRTSRRNTEISWSYTEVPSNTQFVVTYELSSSSKILRDKMILVDDTDAIYLNAVRILKSKPDGSGYGVIMAVMPERNISREISIREKIPLSYSVIPKGDYTGNVIEEEDDGQRIVTWKINNPEKDKIYQLFINYIGEDNYNFDMISLVVDNEEKQATQSSGMVLKDETIAFPEEYYELIEP